MKARSGHRTRARLLDAAEEMILEKGYAATSVDRIIDQVGVTKGSFFYHFKTKGDLAQALIRRYADRDAQMLHENLERAERLSDDPLQQLLIFFGLLLEVAEELDREPSAGCLFASYAYESGLFDEDTNEIVADALRLWRLVLSRKLGEVMAVYPPRLEVDTESLADMASVVFEGAFILSRSLPGTVFVDQLGHYRRYLELLFRPSRPGEARH